MKSVVLFCSAIFIVGTMSICAADKNEKKSPETGSQKATLPSKKTQLPTLSAVQSALPSHEEYLAKNAARLAQLTSGIAELQSQQSQSLKTLQATYNAKLQDADVKKNAKAQGVEFGEFIGRIRNIAAHGLDIQPISDRQKLQIIVGMIDDYEKSLK